MPVTLRQAAARGLTSLSPHTWDRVLTNFNALLPAKLKLPASGYRLHKLAEVLAVPSPEAMYAGLVSHWKNPEALVIGSSEPMIVLSDRQRWARLPDFTQGMMYLDTVISLPDRMLVKVDRATMGVSLEARVPFLDRGVV